MVENPVGITCRVFPEEYLVPGFAAISTTIRFFPCRKAEAVTFERVAAFLVAFETT